MIASPDAVPRVHIVTPALAGANNGNAHTAARWQGFLAPVAACEVALQWRGEPADLLIALHARLSAGSIAAFHAAHPELPIAVVLTGTDLYRDIEDDASAQHSLDCASALVVLQDEGPARLDAAARAKARVIVQSAPSLLQPPRPAAQAEFVAVGHLREEKDPLTLMAAARLAGRRCASPTSAPRSTRRSARRPRRRCRRAPATAGSARWSTARRGAASPAPSP
jgi:hypothetical protein